MKVYSFHNGNSQAYLYAPMPIVDSCNPDPPRSIKYEWLTPTFELIGCDEFRCYLPKTDFPTLIYGTAVLSSRAVNRLSPMLGLCGETLPIRLSNDPEQFYLFNVTRVVDAIDMPKSKFRRFPSGRIMCCERLVFDPPRVPSGACFFKTNQMGPADTIFATQQAVDMVQRARLTGHAFELAWTNDVDERTGHS